MNLYKSLVRPGLFAFDSEWIHEQAIRVMGWCGGGPVFQGLGSALWEVRDARLKTKVFGLEFSNPVGLAAGFDKEAQLVPALSALGFGHIEIGSVTALAQEGNPRPRIFRLNTDEALINRMGFPSSGAAVVADRLKLLKRKPGVVLGVNLGKTKIVPIESALDDYLESFKQLLPYGDYFAINVSSPNTPELRKLQEPDRLRSLLQGIQAANARAVPLLVKISPDLSFSEVDAVLEVAEQVGVQGIIATNTTFARDGIRTNTSEQGGLSGKPLHQRSVAMVAHCYQALSGKLPVIGVGGVFSAEQAITMFSAGASLVQIYTGFIYEGPSVAAKINRGLLRFLEQENLDSVRSLVGIRL